MKKLIPAILLCLLSTGASANEARNGLQLNGLRFNSVQLNGLRFNGYTLNRIAWNVITINTVQPTDTAVFDALADMASAKLAD
ncbi:hypothetical protein [Sedimentitalea todarodis]|uniref:Uncharacterized protein n=1 Tax=Sedimentitalea todarodis TaxID=1631240 RepID=A0ABU3VLC7_9RHOB|nr:hypothetical protein [Sedimentitalea todarodis]MDU9006913.1 hypothetical protein [Sedimentitalea todarodis]